MHVSQRQNITFTATLIFIFIQEPLDRVDVVEKQVKYTIFYQVQLNTCSRLITLSLKIKHDFYGFFIFNFRFQVVLQTLNQRAVMESKFYRNHMQ